MSQGNKHEKCTKCFVIILFVCVEVGYVFSDDHFSSHSVYDRRLPSRTIR